ELEMAITVPRQCRDALAGDDAEPAQCVGQPPGAGVGVAIGVTMNRSFDRARNDLGVAVTLIGMPDQRRNRQRPAHHQTEHRYSPSLTSSPCCAAASPWIPGGL